MSVFDWIFDAANDVIDLYFVQSDLYDIDITEAERCKMAHYDSMASENDQPDDDPRPMGMRQY